MDIQSVFAINGVAIDLANETLRDASGNPIVLRPQCFAVLRHLVENANRLVTKDELMAAVWPGHGGHRRQPCSMHPRNPPRSQRRGACASSRRCRSAAIDWSCPRTLAPGSALPPQRTPCETGSCRSPRLRNPDPQPAAWTPRHRRRHGPPCHCRGDRVVADARSRTSHRPGTGRRRSRSCRSTISATTRRRATSPTASPRT